MSSTADDSLSPATSTVGKAVAFEFEGERHACFGFSGPFGTTNFPSVSPSQQTRFQKDFVAQLAALGGYGWLVPGAKLLPPRLTAGPYRPRDFHVFVSEQYEKSMALVPAWLGQRGWMEFPAHRVAAGQASITHELVHVLFPNGNRMLAEGLAVYLQRKLLPNVPVYPNFGDHLESVIAEFLFTTYPRRTAFALWAMDIEALEQISTPDELSLRIGRDRPFGASPGISDPPPEQVKFIYAISGSLVEFLLDPPLPDPLLTRENFAALYGSTPLRPLDRNCGDPDRWQKHYADKKGGGYSFADIVLLWKTYMHFVLCGKLAKHGKETPIPDTPPENYAKQPLVHSYYKKLNDSFS